MYRVQCSLFRFCPESKKQIKKGDEFYSIFSTSIWCACLRWTFKNLNWQWIQWFKFHRNKDKCIALDTIRITSEANCNHRQAWCVNCISCKCFFHILLECFKKISLPLNTFLPPIFIFLFHPQTTVLSSLSILAKLRKKKKNEKMWVF